MVAAQALQEVRPSPFLKWAGGKGHLTEVLEKFVPRSFRSYYEPFLGGGAFFFHLFSIGRITDTTISDSNRDLIDCYLALRDKSAELLVQLKALQEHSNDREFYYQKRDRFNELRLRQEAGQTVEKSALLIYLNKTCYNGLFRVSDRDKFNVPWGRYKNPSIYSDQNILAVSEALRRTNIKIRCCDFAGAGTAAASDFVYLDPPYQPISATSNFTSYTVRDFGHEDQVRLSELCLELDSKGCYFLVSNSPRVEKLYSSFYVHRVKSVRVISCKGKERGPVDELLITNYGAENMPDS